MPKDFYFKFYPQDFITGVFDMEHAEVGKYIRILCYMHQHGALTMKQLEKICDGAVDAEIMAKLYVIKKKDEPLRYGNKRLEHEMEATRRKSDTLAGNRRGKTKPPPWDDPKFDEVWRIWSEYKKEQFNFEYKPRSLRSAQVGLFETSGGDADVAEKMVRQSIRAGYRGIFPLKKQKTDESDHDRRNRERTEELRAFVEG